MKKFAVVVATKGLEIQFVIDANGPAHAKDTAEAMARLLLSPKGTMADPVVTGSIRISELYKPSLMRRLFGIGK